MDSYEQYKIHFALLPYRNDSAADRLSTLMSDIIQPSATVCGFAALLSFLIEKSTVDLSLAMQEIHQQMNMICDKLNQCREAARFKDGTMVSENEIEQALDRFWTIRTITDELKLVTQEVQDSQDLMLDEFGGTAYWLEALTVAANHIRADIEVLSRPHEVDIPIDIITAHDLLRVFSFDKVNDMAYLSALIQLAHHPLSVIRISVAGLLRHYDDEDAIDTLIKLLQDDAEDVVAGAASSLGFHKRREAIPSLVQCLDRNFSQAAYIGWIAEALAEMPDEQALKPLIYCLDELMKKPHAKDSIQVLPIAGVRKAIQVIGGTDAEDALKRHFG